MAKNAKKIKLLDTRVYRGGVYKLQEELEGVEFEKVQTPNSKSLEYALEGSENVIYFTHDYLSMSHAKGNILEATAKAAHTVGVSKLICVCPIESDMYYTEDNESPVNLKTVSEEKAFNANPNMVVMHSNLLFGDYTYFIRYMTQSIIAGKIHRSLANPADKVHYFPIHYEDLTSAVHHAIENYETVNGKTYSVKGAHDITLPELKGLIERQCAGSKKASFTTNTGIGNFIGEFFRGIGHDQNM